ncbi:MarR family transcriptional regulator [Rhodococcus aerolatus]
MVTPESCGAVVEELRRTTRQHRHYQQRMGREHVADVALLAAVDAAGALRLSDLAGTLLVDASVVSRQVSALVDEGLLRREVDPADGRSRLLHVTGPGAEALARLRTAGCALLTERLADWEDEDVRTLARLLRRFNDSLSESFSEGLDQLARSTTSSGGRP